MYKHSPLRRLSSVSLAALLLVAGEAKADVLQIEPTGETGWVARSAAPQAAQGRAVARAAPAHLASHFLAAADRVVVSPALLEAVAGAESSFAAQAVSPKGAQGVMQLMPATARMLGVRDPKDPAQNIQGGAAYLSRLLKAFDGDTVLALAAYNAGPGAVRRHGGVPPYPETRAYVRRVLDALAAAADRQP